MSSWQISGQYMETCNCDLLCPCITSNMTARPTEGECKVALGMRIDKGSKDGVSLDGVCFVLVLHSPGPMAQGNMTAGLIVDSKASDQQAEAIAAIATGAAGGPMGALAPLVGRVAGMERRPISFESHELQYSVRAGDLVDQVADGLPSGLDPKQPIYVDNVAHPLNTRLAIAKATRSVIHAFGIDWEDRTGTRNGHFAPFSWAG